MKSLLQNHVELIKIMPNKKKYYFCVAIYIVSAIICPFLTSKILSQIVGVFQSNITIANLFFPLCGVIICNIIVEVFSSKVRKYNFLFRISLISLIVKKSIKLNIEFIESNEGIKAHEDGKRAIFEGNNVGVEIFLNKCMSIFITIISVIIELVLLLKVSFVATLVLLISLFLTIYINYIIEREDEKIQNQLSNLYVDIDKLHYSIIDESNQKDIHLYNVKKIFGIKFKKIRVKILKKWNCCIRLYRRGEIVNLCINMVRELFLGGLLFFNICNNNINMELFVFIMSSFVYFKGWQDSLLNDFQDIVQNNIIVKKFIDFMKCEDCYNRKISKCVSGDIRCIELNSINYSYGNEKVINNVSLKIKKGEKIAIVGANGAGKTTLANIILGFYKPCSGNILLNNTTLKENNISWYVKQFSALFQNSIVFPFTVEENITGERNVGDKNKLCNILKLTHIDDFINIENGELSENLTKKIDERGIELSGGQIQRLLLARTIYNSSELVVLDEPTSALDPIVEKNIYNTYIKELKEKTVIFITHKLNSVHDCDKIYFLERGRILEEGSHTELMELRGKYYKMYNEQVEQYRTS